MALFSLTDIGFKTDTRVGTDKLVNSQYQTNLYRYPSDLGAADKGHYVVFNINEQINTANEFKGQAATGDVPTIQSNRAMVTGQSGIMDSTSTIYNGINLGGQAINAIADSSVGQAIKGTINAVGSLFGGSGTTGQDAYAAGAGFINEFTGQIDPNVGIRTIRRITDTVALYMPDTLAFSYNQQYESLNPGRDMLQALASGLATASGTAQSGGDVKETLKSVAPFLFNYATRNMGDFGKVLFTAGSGGKVNNPMMEVLYTSPEFRSFRFDFMMYPRSEQEATEVQNLINRFRFHQAPELVKGSGGFFLYPPSEFDISFYYNGQENPNIPRISTCVLTNMDVDYAPQGFHAYEVPGENFASLGRTGMPVAIRLSLQFKETEYIVKGSPLLGNDQRTSAEKSVSDSLKSFMG